MTGGELKQVLDEMGDDFQFIGSINHPKVALIAATGTDWHTVGLFIKEVIEQMKEVEKEARKLNPPTDL